MKNRTSFVSNSSSSSFICDISGEDIEVYDLDFKSSGLCRCTAGHVFKEEYLFESYKHCISHKEMFNKLIEITDSKKECQYYQKLNDIELRKVYDEKIKSNGNPIGGDYPANCCPICSINVITDADLVKYFLKKFNVSREDISKDIRVFFGGSFIKFQSYIKE
jgi:hypothetical protein